MRLRVWLSVYVKRYWARLTRPKHSILSEIAYLFRKGKVFPVNGYKMELNRSDTGIHKDLILYGKREVECTEIVKKVLSSKERVLDIGANIGYYVLLEAGTGAKVTAVEPEWENLVSLSNNIALNRLNVRVINCAVGERNGMAFLKRGSCSNRHVIASEGEPVAMRTVDSLGEFDFIRMDVEGYEAFVIKGMKETLRIRRPLKMLIEVHTKGIKNRGGSVDEFLQELSAGGFILEHFVVSKDSFWRWFGGISPPKEENNRCGQALSFVVRARRGLFNLDGYTLFLRR